MRPFFELLEQPQYKRSLNLPFLYMESSYHLVTIIFIFSPSSFNRVYRR